MYFQYFLSAAAFQAGKINANPFTSPLAPMPGAPPMIPPPGARECLPLLLIYSSSDFFLMFFGGF